MTDDEAALRDALARTERLLERERSKLARERTLRREVETLAESSLANLYKKERQQAFLSDVARESNAATSGEAALGFVVAETCRQMGWAFGTSFLVSGEGEFRQGPSHVEVADVDWFLDEAAGSGLADLARGAAASPLPTWEVSADGFAIGGPYAPRTAMTVPIASDGRVFAVVQAFSQRSMEPDEATLAVMCHAAAHVAHVFERRLASERLLHDATHDALTGLPNRAAILSILDGAIADRAAGRRSSLHVAFVDMDRFKFVNDSLGHEAGDRFLTQVAERFAAACAAAPGCVLGRIGGDEFVVVMQEGMDDAEALRLATSLLDGLAEPLDVGVACLQASASVGLSGCMSGVTCASDVLRNADAAMYRAKSRGKSMVSVFDAELRDERRHRIEVENNLRHALDTEAFRLAYQPVVSMATREVVGYEALIRLAMPNGTLMSPDGFVAVAEDTGLIVPIGSWVLREACRATARLNATWPGRRPVYVNVNVSAKQVQHPGLVSDVESALSAASCLASWLNVEVTESSAVADFVGTGATLRRIAAMGTGCVLDDFGTGYSSLRYLHELPFRTVKVDRGFVKDMAGSGAQIVKAVVTMAQSFDMDVVAEGVEDEATLAALAAIGCGFAQGYLFSRPMPEEALWRGPSFPDLLAA